jgi:hypothetical protein
MPALRDWPDSFNPHPHAVDRCYRQQPFATDRERIEFLFALYEKLTTPLLPSAKPKRATGQ